MAGNPKTSKWRSPKQAARKRKLAAFSLSDEAHKRLAELAVRDKKTKSAIIEELILAAP
jgi:predicted DNA-binding protein